MSNWRGETRDGLMPLSLAWTAWAAPADPAFVARCVKLNNYWCIKRARWDGEIGGPGGHTDGFATAGHGADAAVSLLRRYYGSTGAARRSPSSGAGLRRNARARSRPAPRRGARPGPGLPGSRRPGAAGPRPHPAGALPRQPRPGRGAPAGRPDAPPGGARPPGRRQPLAGPALVGARPDAGPAAPAGAGRHGGGAPHHRHRHRRGAARHRLDRRVGRAGPDPRRRAAGRGGRRPADARRRPGLVAAAGLAPARAPLRLRRGPHPGLCRRIAGSVGVKPGDDLELFTADGRATPRLAPVLLAMSSVELGALRASPALVAAAIARADAERTAARRQAEAGPPAAP